MSPPWDVFGVGAAVGGTAGILAGYQLRKLVVHVQDWRRDRALAKRRNEFKREQKTERERDEAYFEKRKSDLGIIPLQPVKRTKRNTPQERQQIPVVNPDRDDVIAALMGSGYSKADATKAADSCSLVERAHGLEAWTRAAFNNAHRSKS